MRARDVTADPSVCDDVIAVVGGARRRRTVAADHLVPDELEELSQWKLLATAAARQQVDAELLAAVT